VFGVRRLNQQSSGAAALPATQFVVVIATTLSAHGRRAAKLAIIFRVLTKPEAAQIHTPFN
jgi:hypothetical protein